MNGEMLRALLAMLTTQAVVVMAANTAPVLGKQITDGLQISPALVGYYTSIVFAFAMAASLASGQLIQKFGSVRVSQATVFFAALGLLCLAVGSSAAVVISAIFIGLAYAPGNPASSQLLLRTTPPQRRNAIFSLKQTAVPLGVAMVGITAPLLLTLYPWQTALLLLAGFCGLLILAVEACRPSLDAHRPPNVIKHSVFASLRIVLRTPALRRLGLVSLALASVQFGFGAIFVTYLQDAHQVSTGIAGLLLSIAMILSVVSRIVLGASADRFGGRQMLLAMSVMMAVSAAVFVISAGAAFPIIATTGVVLGATAFSWNGVYLAEVACSSPKESVASATAGTMFFVFLGGFIGPGLLSVSISMSGSYEAGFAVLCGTSALGALALLLPDRAFAPAIEAS